MMLGRICAIRTVGLVRYAVTFLRGATPPDMKMAFANIADIQMISDKR